MKDAECVRLLQECLPRLRLRCAGFRKVRRQVCKRIDRRMKALGLSGPSAYRDYLEAHPGEWAVLDALCRIPISRFYRDRGVFDRLAQEVLPALADAARARGEPELRCWCAGCASGEEPYTMALLWEHGVAPRFPGLGIRILATDADPHLLARARAGRYAFSSLKELPEGWVKQAFTRSAGRYEIREAYRERVAFLRQDIRRRMPAGPFHLILCRNLVLTYFEEALQREIVRKLADRLLPGGALVVGIHESLPGGIASLVPWSETLRIYRRPDSP